MFLTRWWRRVTGRGDVSTAPSRYGEEAVQKQPLPDAPSVPAAESREGQDGVAPAGAAGSGPRRGGVPGDCERGRAPDLDLLFRGPRRRIATGSSRATRWSLLETARVLIESATVARIEGRSVRESLEARAPRRRLEDAVAAVLGAGGGGGERLVRSAAWALDAPRPARLQVGVTDAHDVAHVARTARGEHGLPPRGTVVWWWSRAAPPAQWLEASARRRLPILLASSAWRPRGLLPGVLSVHTDARVSRARGAAPARLRVDGGAAWIQALLTSAPAGGWHPVRPPWGFSGLTGDPDVHALLDGVRVGRIGPGWADGAHTRLAVPHARTPNPTTTAVVLTRLGTRPAHD